MEIEIKHQSGAEGAHISMFDEHDCQLLVDFGSGCFLSAFPLEDTQRSGDW